MSRTKTRSNRREIDATTDARRIEFSVEQQLIGKLGRPGFGKLLDKLNSITRKEK